jgi:hypothetical protein
MKDLSTKILLRRLQKELNDLRKIDVNEIDDKTLDKQIKKSKAIAYLVSVAIQLIERDLSEEVEELKKAVMEMKK